MNDSSEINKVESESGLVRFGDPGRYESWLVGNEAGFKSLRKHLDRLLESGEDVSLEHQSVCQDIDGLSLNQNHCEQEKIKSSPFSALGCIAITTLILSIFVLGIWKVFELVT
jgi:hypothetical protein